MLPPELPPLPALTRAEADTKRLASASPWVTNTGAIGTPRSARPSVMNPQ